MKLWHCFKVTAANRIGALYLLKFYLFLSFFLDFVSIFRYCFLSSFFVSWPTRDPIQGASDCESFITHAVSNRANHTPIVPVPSLHWDTTGDYILETDLGSWVGGALFRRAYGCGLMPGRGRQQSWRCKRCSHAPFSTRDVKPWEKRVNILRHNGQPPGEQKYLQSFSAASLIVI